MFFCSRVFCESAVFDPVESWVFAEGFLFDSLFDEESLPLKKDFWFVGAGCFEKAVDLFEVFRVDVVDDEVGIRFHQGVNGIVVSAAVDVFEHLIDSVGDVQVFRT